MNADKELRWVGKRENMCLRQERKKSTKSFIAINRSIKSYLALYFTLYPKDTKRVGYVERHVKFICHKQVTNLNEVQNVY